MILGWAENFHRQSDNDELSSITSTWNQSLICNINVTFLYLKYELTAAKQCKNDLYFHKMLWAYIYSMLIFFLFQENSQNLRHTVFILFYHIFTKYTYSWIWMFFLKMYTVLLFSVKLQGHRIFPYYLPTKNSQCFSIANVILIEI